jgi:hypothetical protein
MPVAARSKGCVCGRSVAGVAGSNLAAGTNISLLWMLHVVGYRCLRRADHSSRGVLSSVVYVGYRCLRRADHSSGGFLSSVVTMKP